MSATQSTANLLKNEPVRRLAVGPWLIELLPQQSYETSYIPEQSAIGFAFDSQQGTHAFASDRKRPFYARASSLAFTPKGCEVFSSSPNGGEYLRVMNVGGVQLDGLTQCHFNDVVDPAAIVMAADIRKLLLNSGSSIASFSIEEMTIFLAERVQLVLDGRLPEAVSARSMTPARLKYIDELIDSAIDQALTVGHMAASLGLSEGFFIRAFKEAVGKSSHSYLIDRRLSKARILLRTTRHDLREIALATGFSSHAHMASVFRERLGIAPSDLRHRIQAYPECG
jgi:AraC family transcriptional regulator